MLIKCPECSKELNIGSAKAGSYKPKCKHCSAIFRLKITDDVPPRIGVGKLVAPGTPTVVVQPPQSTVSGETSLAPESVEATIDSSNASRKVPDVSKPSQSKPSQSKTAAKVNVASEAVEATIDSADVEGTMDSRPNVTTTERRDTTLAGSPVDQTLAGGESGSRVGASSLVHSGSRSQSMQANPGTVPAERLGGYRLIRVLGRGAMGEVYEARQLSLDRPVALKTIRDSISKNASALARFTREAYAAAQLTHHNVVQIYDFGEENGKHFFSMEWVRGGPLSELVQAKGALEPRLAASYTLQAARGLALAHRSGMVHRDVKPANLLLTDDGVVKVADLGLVKIPDLPEPDSDRKGVASALSSAASGTDVTMHGTAVGTPAYMSPEQAVDAASVDHRADIYSLGCSLFYLLTGRPPFDSKQVSAVMDGHINQPPPKATSINAKIPTALDKIIDRALAKRPEDRYSILSEMIQELESFLDVRTDGKFSPTSHQSDQWANIVQTYTSTYKPVSTSIPLLIFGLAGMLMFGISLMIGWRWIAMGPMTIVAAALTAIALLFRSDNSPLIDHLRSWFGSLRWIDYGIGFVSTVVAAIVIVLVGLWPGAIVGGIVGAGLAAGVYFGLLAPKAIGTASAVEQAERFLRDLRLSGCDEDGVRDFCARYGGKHWQGLFERLFGYTSLVKQRSLLATDRSFNGSTRSSLRDKACHWLNSKTEANRRLHDQSKLEKIEKQGLRAEGLSESEAAEKAYQMASALMEASKNQIPQRADKDAVDALVAKRERMKAMMAEARSGKYKRPRDRWAPVKLLLGNQTRLALGLLLLAVFAMWGNSQGLFDSVKEMDVSGLATGNIDLEEFSKAANSMAAQSQIVDDAPTSVGSVRLNSPWSMGIAGLLLTCSAFIATWKMTPFALVGTGVILAGASIGIPSIGTLLPAWLVAAGIGALIFIPGMFLSASRNNEF